MPQRSTPSGLWHFHSWKGWYVWAQTQRGSQAEEQSPICKIFNPTGNRSYTGQADWGDQTGKTPKQRTKPAVYESDEKRAKIPAETDKLVKGAQWEGFKYTGNKAQVSHISNQGSNKEGSKTNNTGEDRIFKIKQEVCEDRRQRFWQHWQLLLVLNRCRCCLRWLFFNSGS